jgi:hypothetical protein
VSSEEQANGTMKPEASRSDAAQANPTLAHAAPKKKGLLIGIGIVVLVALLAGAAFVGGRLLNGQGLPGLSSGGPSISIGPGGGKSVRISSKDVLPAKELPQTPADVRGLFDHRQDNSLFIGTGNVTMSVMKDQSGQVHTSASHTGPVVEVVVTNQTKVYEDVTMQQFNGPPPQGQKIQQVVQPGSLDGVGQYSDITVWGRKTGDRYIADVLVYTQPAFIKKGP